MFEAVHSERSSAGPAAAWALIADLGRWPEWSEQVERASVDGELAPGATLAIKLRRGGTVRHRVLAVEPGRMLAIEARFPGGRQGNEHRVEARGSGCEISHRVYVRGPVWPLLALLFGRKRMRRTVTRSVGRLRELVE